MEDFMKNKCYFLFILFCLPLLAHAETVRVSDGTTLRFDIPAGWELTTEPPAFLLEEMAEHLSHDAAEKGYSPGKEQLLEAARKRLAANEVLLFNPVSKSYLTLDLSHMSQGERPPSIKTIKLSAKYAGESLEHEEGVSNLKSTTGEVAIAGGGTAYRYAADYLLHDDPRHFSGIIGFVSPYWYFFYYTDFLKDPEDKQRAERLINSLKIEIQR
jgi:hypothetical protein